MFLELVIVFVIFVVLVGLLLFLVGIYFEKVYVGVVLDNFKEIFKVV